MDGQSLPLFDLGGKKLKISDDDREFADEDKLIDSLKPALDLFSKTTFRTAEECIEHCRLVFFRFHLRDRGESEE